jgi:hypothetical protein
MVAAVQRRHRRVARRQPPLQDAKDQPQRAVRRAVAVGRAVRQRRCPVLGPAGVQPPQRAVLRPPGALQQPQRPTLGPAGSHDPYVPLSLCIPVGHQRDHQAQRHGAAG